MSEPSGLRGNARSYLSLIAATAMLWLCLNCPAKYLSMILTSQFNGLPNGGGAGACFAFYLVLFSSAIVCTVAMRKRLRRGRSRRANAVIAVVVLAGLAGYVALYSVARGAQMPAIVLTASLFLVLLLFSNCLAIWGDALFKLPLAEIPLIIAGACMVSDALRWALTLCEFDFGYVIAAAAAVAFLYPLLAREGFEGASEARTLRSAPWRIIVCSIILLALWTIVMRFGLTSQDAALTYIDRGVAYLISAAILFCFALYFWRSSCGAVSKKTFLYPFVAIVVAYMGALAAMLLGAVGFVPAKIMLISIAHCLEIFVLILLAYYVCERRLSSSSIYGIFIMVSTSNHLFDTFGPAAGNQMAAIEPIVAGLSFVTAVILIIFLLAYASESPVEAEAAAADDRHRALCKRAAAKSNLTKKELEVMTLLYRGFSSKRIADELYISDNTARTHIGNIYRKLGVHSKQDLMKLVDGYRENL